MQLLILLVTLATTAAATPLFGRTEITRRGSLRPRQLITRQLDLVDLLPRDLVSVNGPLVAVTSSSESTSGTGSSSSTCGLTGCAESSESASGGMSATSGTSCQFLGGCASAASAACEQNNNVTNVTTSSSLCGDGKSTNSKGILSAGLLDGVGSLVGGSSKRVVRSLAAALRR
ncbi:Uu.00g020940.m01.CDS01 [Anthostomella pinea]|uniref:Uu.00g020940.m01.CDS01 n=1 Tax=Anthostomella pinea TaxID=933095 RepID=A0AAI8W041_9PEZI|nr:Uu.00g020940.m01.CDS01 [Anthostomella pinea]